MDRKLRQSVPARVTALGFVVVILCGNFILVRMVMQTPASPWMAQGLWLGVGAVGVGGIGMALLTLVNALRGRDEDGAPEDPDE